MSDTVTIELQQGQFDTIVSVLQEETDAFPDGDPMGAAIADALAALEAADDPTSDYITVDDVDGLTDDVAQEIASDHIAPLTRKAYAKGFRHALEQWLFEDTTEERAHALWKHSARSLSQTEFIGESHYHWWSDHDVASQRAVARIIDDMRGDTDA